MKFLYTLIIKYIKDVIDIKKLPEIYKNSFEKVIDNNKKSYHITNTTNISNPNLEMSNKEINDVIDSIFNSSRYAFNIPVMIKTSDKVYNTSLITKKNGYILTYDRNIIKINDIISIEIKNT